MISMDELLGKTRLVDLSADVEKNLKNLLVCVNKVRVLWAKPMTVTSGFRNPDDHRRIYAAKGITDDKKIPWKSKHLFGAAVDIADEGLLITKWLKANPKILEDAELWCEEGNKNWVHFQIFPPASGNRWFLP